MPCGGPKELPLVFALKGEQRVGMLHLPQGGGPHPLVICLHSLCGSKYFFTDLARRFSFFGMAVFRFDFLGHGDSQGSLLDLTLQAELEDCRQAVGTLSGRADLDAKRIGLLGHSLGGAAAALVAGDPSQGVKALALWAPVLDTLAWRDANLARDNRAGEGRRRHPSGALLSERLFEEAPGYSPDQAALDFPGQVFLAHSRADQRLPQAPSLDWEARRRARDKAIESFWPERSDHFFEDAAERELLLKKTQAFFTRALPVDLL